MTTIDTVQGSLLDARHEARAFWRLRARLVVNRTRQLVRESRLQVLAVLVTSLVFWLILFLLFVEGFQLLSYFLDDQVTRDMATSAVISVFFASLMVMLVFSSAIILYSGCYRSREAQFLLTIPARSERVFLYKFQEAMLFSSWGFLLLGSPMLVAYGLVNLAPWYYFVTLIPFLLAFVMIPGSAGALLCLVIVRRLPTLRLHVAGISVALVALVGAWITYSAMQSPEGDLMTPQWFNDLLARLRFSEHRLLPSWWLSTGLLSAARREWDESVLFLTLLIANALAMHQLTIAASARWYRSGLNVLYGARSTSLAIELNWLDRMVGKLLFFLSPQSRTLMIKDLRLFRRDPVQWMQFLIFFGLLGLYFTNVAAISIRHAPCDVGEHGQLFESGRRGVDSIDVHEPIYFPDDQSRRATVLDFGFVARGPIADPMDKVLVRRVGFDHSVRGAGRTERFDAARDADRDGHPFADMRRPVSGIVGAGRRLRC